MNLYCQAKLNRWLCFQVRFTPRILRLPWSLQAWELICRLGSSQNVVWDRLKLLSLIYFPTFEHAQRPQIKGLKWIPHWKQYNAFNGTKRQHADWTCLQKTGKIIIHALYSSTALLRMELLLRCTGTLQTHRPVVSHCGDTRYLLLMLWCPSGI